jgi:LysR family hydrogen peroxide-inducible transcriptional activator
VLLSKAVVCFRGVCVWAFFHRSVPYLLPSVIQKLHREHPSLRIIIREENTQELDEGLRSGRLDMIISTPEDHPAANIT